MAAFVDAHLGSLTREAVRMATARLPDGERRRLLVAHGADPDVRGRHAGR